MVAGSLLLDLFQGADETGPGIVDDDVEPAEGPSGRLDGRRDRGSIADVEHDPANRSGELGQEICHRPGAPHRADDAIAVGQCGVGESATEPAAGAGDEPDSGRGRGRLHRALLVTRRVVSSVSKGCDVLSRRCVSSRCTVGA